MYPSSGTTIRHDINICVTEASAADDLFIGLAVMPAFGVDAKSGQYPKVQIAEGMLLNADLATERAPTGSYNEVERKYGVDTYDCVDRGLVEVIGDTTKYDLKRFFDIEVAAGVNTMRNVRLAHESRVAAAIMNTGNFAATNSVTAYTAANLATMDVPQDIINATSRVKNNVARPNTVVMSEDVFTRASLSTKLQNFIRGTLKGAADMPINAANIALAFKDYGVERVLIGSARKNTSKKGQAKSVSQIWPTTYMWVGYTNPAATSIQMGGAGFTLYWNEEGGLWVTESYTDADRRAKKIRVRQNTAEKVTDSTAGTLIATQYA